jgi:hypothetical protein
MESVPARAVVLACIVTVTYLWAGRGAGAMTPVVALVYAAIYFGIEQLSGALQLPLPAGPAFVAIVLTALSVLPAELAPLLPESEPPSDLPSEPS